MVNNSLNIPEELASMKEFPLDTLIGELNNLRPMEVMSFKTFPTWGYVLIAIGVVILAVTSICLYCKCRNSKLLSLIMSARNKRAKRNKKVLPDKRGPGYKAVGQSSSDGGVSMSALLRIKEEEENRETQTCVMKAPEVKTNVITQKFPVLDSVKRNCAPC